MVSACNILLPAHMLPHTQSFLCGVERSEPDQSSSGTPPLWLWWNCWVAFASSQTFYESKQMFWQGESGYVCVKTKICFCICVCVTEGLNGEQVSTAFEDGVTHSSPWCMPTKTSTHNVVVMSSLIAHSNITNQIIYLNVPD